MDTGFFDLHCHMLCGIDDGAKSRKDMFSMLDMAYEDGIRAICLTPHFCPYLQFEATSSLDAELEALRGYAAEHYPDLNLYAGNELGYYDGCLSALASGSCRTLEGSRYVLTDFPAETEFSRIEDAMYRLRRSGYVPILAHTERYSCLAKHMDWVEDFVADGGVVQINASSLSGDWGHRAKVLWKQLLSRGLVHVISTDAHNLTSRPPKMSVCMDYLNKHFHREIVFRLTWENANRIVHNQPVIG